MNKLYSLVTVGFFCLAPYFFVSQYGKRWGFGAYGLPKTLLAEDGMHYLDGTAVDPLILSIVRSGLETELQLVCLGVVATLLIALFRVCRQWERTHRNLYQLRERSETLRR